jgi:Carboxypeptidase regulatory-like domain
MGGPVLRKLVTLSMIVVLAGVVAIPAMAQATRTLQGQVANGSDAPLSGAVVYLKNTKTLAVRTYISDNSGGYKFTSLSPNVDYEVYAEFKGAKSDNKTLSAFDSRPTAVINLKINAK